MSVETYELDLNLPEALELTESEKASLKEKFRAALVEVFEARNQEATDTVTGDIQIVRAGSSE